MKPLPITQSFQYELEKGKASELWNTQIKTADDDEMQEGLNELIN